MKCKHCEKDAIIRLRQHNISLCRDHYQAFFMNRVRKAIDDFEMFSKSDRILVAVSGGKDSLVLWDVLTKMGYQCAGLYINLGIGQYSEISKSKAFHFAEQNGFELHIENVADYLDGLSTPQAARLLRRKACSVCGLVKRYIMNSFSFLNGYDVIATGHNLDDEVASLFGNVVHWQMGYLEKQYPVLRGSTEKLTDKVKPFIYLSEREVVTYALMNNIDYIMEECPSSKGASSIIYKNLMNNLELAQPGAKHRFLVDYFKNKTIFKGVDKELANLKECPSCGFPTTTEVCSYCKLLERIQNREQ